MEATENTTVKTETLYGTFHSWPQDLITEQLQKYSAHTRNELAMVKSFVRPGDTIVDIGGHIGTFSIPFARFTAPGGRVFSFEANPGNFSLLKKNIECNQLQDVITATHAVVSESRQTFRMALPTNGNSGTYYFLPNTAEGGIEIPSVNVDEWFKENAASAPVQLLKIDVEGAEVSVLRACHDLINRCKPIIYIEINEEALQRFRHGAADIEELLAPHGYHFFRNIGLRNSDNDSFRIARLRSVPDGGDFFDLLAIPAGSDRYPKAYVEGLSYDLWKQKTGLLDKAKRFVRSVLGK